MNGLIDLGKKFGMTHGASGHISMGFMDFSQYRVV